MVETADRICNITTKPVTIFDLGCGTGAVEAEIYAAVPKEQWGILKVLAGDISTPMLEYLKARGQEEGWTGLETRVVDGTKLEQVDEDLLAHIFVGFAIFVLPPDTVTKLAAKLASGGTLALSTWASLPWYDLLARTYAKMDNGPELPSSNQLWLSMTNGRPWNDISFVTAQLEEVGLQKVEVVQKKFNVNCGTPDIFMTTMGFMLRMLSKQWPEEKREEWLQGVGETMKELVREEAGGDDKHVFMDFEGIVGVGVKGQ